MRITKHTDYALRVLLYLAARPGERVPTQSIADAHRISLNHLHKVVRSLGEHGYLRLHRGAGGGVILARAPEEIFVGQVMRDLEVAESLVECFRPDQNACVLSPACGLKGALKNAQSAFYAELDPISFADLVRGSQAELMRALTGG